jgi:hypothetical protein
VSASSSGFNSRSRHHPPPRGKRRARLVYHGEGGWVFASSVAVRRATRELICPHPHGQSVPDWGHFWRRSSFYESKASLIWYGYNLMAAPLAFERMVERAAQQNGFLRTADARDIGVGPGYLRKLAATGKLQHRGWGLYRLRAIPPTPRDEYQEALLWAGDDAVIGSESALALWELADVNPRAIEVVVPPKVRLRKTRGPKVRLIHERLVASDIDWIDNIRAVTPVKGIAQAIGGGLDGSLIEQAINKARARQLITPISEARLRVGLADREHGTTG